MVRLHFSIDLFYEVAPPGADFVLNIQGAQTPWQTVVWEQLQLSQAVPLLMHTDAATHARYLRLTAAAGPLHVGYRATVDIDHFVATPAQITETPVAALPSDVLTYLYPSRYCQSDRLGQLAMAQFGSLPHGYQRALAIQDWVRQQVAFQPNTSNSMTSALDTLNAHVGVCRDFAHLMLSLIHI